MIIKRTLAVIFLTMTTFSSQIEASIPHFDFPDQGKLTPTMVSYYHNNGFLIFDHCLKPQECDDMLTEAGRLIDAFVPTPESTEVFTALVSEEAERKRGNYFADSIDKISFFLEKDAFQDGAFVVPKRHAINKIGHALGELSKPFYNATFRSSFRSICEQLGVGSPLLNQSMMICKPPKIGGEVKPHQDASFLYSAPNTTTAFWMPLEDATVENACLFAIPGSHKWPLLYRYIKEENEQFTFRDMKGNLLNNDQLADLAKSWPSDQLVPLPMQRGSLIVFNGNLVHGSSPNTSDKSRNAYTFHVISGDSDYPAGNWLQRDKFAALREDPM